MQVHAWSLPGFFSLSAQLLVQAQLHPPAALWGGRSSPCCRGASSALQARRSWRSQGRLAAAEETTLIDPLWLGCVSVVRATVNSSVSYFLLLCCVLNILVCCSWKRLAGGRCCSKEPRAVGWELIEQVKTVTSSIQTKVPLIRAFLEGGERLASLLLPTGCWYLSAVCILLIHRGSITSAQMSRQCCS